MKSFIFLFPLIILNICLAILTEGSLYFKCLFAALILGVIFYTVIISLGLYDPSKKARSNNKKP